MWLSTLCVYVDRHLQFIILIETPTQLEKNIRRQVTYCDIEQIAWFFWHFLWWREIGEKCATSDYIHLNKGVSDIVFLLVESLEFNPQVVDCVEAFYYRLWSERLGSSTYPYEAYKRDFCNSLALFPFFVMVWFNSEDPEKLLDTAFPLRFMKNVLKYYDHYLTADMFQ